MTGNNPALCILWSSDPLHVMTTESWSSKTPGIRGKGMLQLLSPSGMGDGQAPLHGGTICPQPVIPGLWKSQ